MNKLLFLIIFLASSITLACPFMRHSNHKKSSAVSNGPTYTKDVQPILKTHCSSCHNAGWAEKNWMDYDTALKNKDKIKLRVENQTMPPGNTTNMTAEERKVIIQWVDEGGKK